MNLVQMATVYREFLVIIKVCCPQGARHSGLELAFQNVANPTAMLLSSTSLLRHLG